VAELEDNSPSMIDALSRFESRLIQARQLYGDAHRSGREGAALALSAAAEFIFSIPAWRDAGFAAPYTKIAAALHDLDEGSVDPILQSSPRRDGRPPLARARAALNGYAAATMEMLVRGGFTEENAARTVAHHLRSLGVIFKPFLKL
jgi:hypothetical protein